MTVVDISTGLPEPVTALDFALRYASIGWHVFPVWGADNGKCRCRRNCQSPGKHPVEYMATRGQDDATTDEATIRRWWGQMPSAGVAVFLQPSGLVAVDIDPRNGGMETIEDLESRYGRIASNVTQFTQGGGEHRIFALSASSTSQLPGQLGVGVDLKRNGYVVLAPTAGVRGVYEWEASSSPLDGNIASPLPDWIRDLARAAPTSIASPSDRYVTPQQVEELREALTYLPADDYHQWVNFGQALRSIGIDGYKLWDAWSATSSKYDPRQISRKWASFKPGAYNYESIFAAAQAAGWVNPLSGSSPAPAVPVESVAIAAPKEQSATPAHLLNPPGILGQVAQWIAESSRKPQPQFDVQAAIAFCASVMGRRYCTDHRNWPSLYLLNIGKSASGKEHAKWAVENLLEACGLHHLIGPASYTSDSGLLSSMHKQPSHFGCIDEFGKVLEGASVKHSARAASMIRALMEVWGRADGVMRPQGYSTFGMSDGDAAKITERTVRNPALTILAMTTPESFFDAIGSAAARDGFLNRFIIVESEIGRQAGKAAKVPAIPATIIEWAKEAHSHVGLMNPDMTANMAAVPKVIAIDKHALALFSAFENESIAMMDSKEESGLAEMFGRCTEMSMRLSLVVAVACGKQSVGADHAKWAIDYVRHYSVRTVDRLETCVADSEFEAVKMQVLECIRSAGEMGRTEREISQRCRKFRTINQRGQLDVLNSLAFTADISRVEYASTSGRGQPRKAWVAIDADSADTTVCALNPVGASVVGNLQTFSAVVLDPITANGEQGIGADKAQTPLSAPVIQ